MLDVKGILCSLIHNNTVQDMVGVSSFSSSARASIDEAPPPSSHKKNFLCGYSSIGRVSALQAECCEFDARYPLHETNTPMVTSLSALR